MEGYGLDTDASAALSEFCALRNFESCALRNFPPFDFLGAPSTQAMRNITRSIISSWR